MSQQNNLPEMIELAAREMSRTNFRLITDSIAYAESLRDRYGLDFDGRTMARLKCVDIVTGNGVARIPAKVDFEPVIPLNVAILKGVAEIVKADIRVRAALKKMTGRVKVE